MGVGGGGGGRELTYVQREVEAGGGVARVGVGGRVHGQQEVVDQFEQVQVGRRAQHLLDDFNEGQADLLGDGCEVLVPVLLEEKQNKRCCVAVVCRSTVKPTTGGPLYGISLSKVTFEIPLQVWD